MELRGDFSSYSEILDLLQIVSIGRKTGEVLLRNDGENIVLQVKDGRIVGFKTNVPFLEELNERVKKGTLPLSEAIKFILHYVAMWDKGKFSFIEKEINVESKDSIDTVAVMMDFTKEQDELGPELKELFKKDPVFELSEEVSDSVTLDPESWKLVSLLSKGNSTQRAIFYGADSFKSGLEKVYELKEKGLITEVKEIKPKVEEETGKKEEADFVAPEVLEKIREHLVETMGPMGEFLIEETLEDMEISKLPVNLIDAFVENLVEKIPESCLVEGESCRERLKSQISHLLKGGADES